MRIRKSKKTILIGATGVALAISLLLLGGPSNPEHDGRPVSAWFKDLCSGVYGGTPRASRFEAAYEAFSQMESNAVPYLTHQLRYDRSGHGQKLIAPFRQFAVSRPLANNLIWPTEVRNYAAVALRQMGPKAEAAIPALLDEWANDVPEVKISAVAALGSILGRKHTDGASPSKWKKLESEVIAEAVGRYPKLAEALGINLAMNPSEHTVRATHPPQR